MCIWCQVRGGTWTAMVRWLEGAGRELNEKVQLTDWTYAKLHSIIPVWLNGIVLGQQTMPSSITDGWQWLTSEPCTIITLWLKRPPTRETHWRENDSFLLLNSPTLCLHVPLNFFWLNLLSWTQDAQLHWCQGIYVICGPLSMCFFQWCHCYLWFLIPCLHQNWGVYAGF